MTTLRRSPLFESDIDDDLRIIVFAVSQLEKREQELSELKSKEHAEQKECLDEKSEVGKDEHADINILLNTIEHFRTHPDDVKTIHETLLSLLRRDTAREVHKYPHASTQSEIEFYDAVYNFLFVWTKHYTYNSNYEAEKLTCFFGGGKLENKNQVMVLTSGFQCLISKELFKTYFPLGTTKDPLQNALNIREIHYIETCEKNFDLSLQKAKQAAIQALIDAENARQAAEAEKKAKQAAQQESEKRERALKEKIEKRKEEKLKAEVDRRAAAWWAKRDAEEKSNTRSINYARGGAIACCSLALSVVFFVGNLLPLTVLSFLGVGLAGAWVGSVVGTGLSYLTDYFWPFTPQLDLNPYLEAGLESDSDLEPKPFRNSDLHLALGVGSCSDEKKAAPPTQSQEIPKPIPLPVTKTKIDSKLLRRPSSSCQLSQNQQDTSAPKSIFMSPPSPKPRVQLDGGPTHRL